MTGNVFIDKPDTTKLVLYLRAKQALEGQDLSAITRTIQRDIDGFKKLSRLHQYRWWMSRL